LYNLKPVGRIDRDSSDTRTDDVTAAGILPVLGDARLLVPVAVEEHTALLLENAVEVLVGIKLPV
jgi:hypothetical protein